MWSWALSGVATRPRWSIKPWWSVREQVWLVQVEHDIPERGGWIRAWLATPDGVPRHFPSLPVATEAIEGFLAEPDWSVCVELPAV